MFYEYFLTVTFLNGLYIFQFLISKLYTLRFFRGKDQGFDQLYGALIDDRY